MPVATNRDEAATVSHSPDFKFVYDTIKLRCTQEIRADVFDLQDLLGHFLRRAAIGGSCSTFCQTSW